MPREDPTELLGEGVRLARGGLLDKALQHLTDAAERADPAVVAEALRHQADIHRARCDWDAALLLARRSAEVARGADLQDAVAEAENAEAAVHLSRGAFDEARPLLVAMAERTQSPRIRGIAYQNLGYIAAEEGEHESAQKWFDRALNAFRQARYARGATMALMNSGRIALLRGDYETAEGLSEGAAAAARGVDDLELLALACLNLAEALLRLGRTDEAEKPASEALGYFDGTGNDWRRIECLRLFGDIHRTAGDRDSAERCYRAGLQLARRIDARREVSLLEERLDQLDPGAARA
jgi:tetratricopeptide (TPR) repeat protein